jgi:hypothetical protein
MRPAAILAALVAVGILAARVDALTQGAAQPSELEVKAAFVLNFLKFVEWPADRFQTPTAPIVVAVLGNDPLAITLRQTLGGHSLGARAIAVKPAQRATDAVAAHAAFICQSQRPELPAILRTLDRRGVLTIGDSPGYGESGVVLNLVMQGQRVHFEANTAAAARSRVRVSSQLLRIARIVG